jgi:glyoxylase-like metal-dependent hydrolase (beta-lactamase superfamily II)
VIFDAGLSFLGDLYVNAVKTVLGERTPAYCLLTHSHFDHCGAAATLKKHFPELKVLASERASRNLSRPNAIALIRNLTRAAEDFARDMGLVIDCDPVFQPFDVDEVLKDGDQLQVSDKHVIQVIETPGHTWDCLSYYIPSLKALMPSEAAGQVHSNGYIVPDCLVDYDAYLASIRKLSALEIDVLGLGHLYAYTGADASTYLQQSRRTCEEFRERVESYLEQAEGDVQQVMTRIRAIEYDSYPGPKQTEQAYMLNLEARVKAVARRMQSV